MPTLAAEPSIYPQSLLETCDQAAADRRWYVLHTRARQEKVLARQLLSREVPFYLPLVGKNLLIRGACVRSHIPLFLGCVFMFGNDEDRLVALSTRRVVHALRVPAGSELSRDLR